MRNGLFALVALGLSLTVLSGCHPNVFTRDRFEMIKVGVDGRDDVRQMIGKPTSDLGDQWLYDDLKRHHSALIHFGTEGKVSGKEWMDSQTGEWAGQNPDANEPPKGETPERSKKTTRIKKD